LKKLLLIALLIVGCEEDVTESEISCSMEINLNECHTAFSSTPNLETGEHYACLCSGQLINNGNDTINGGSFTYNLKGFYHTSIDTNIIIDEIEVNGQYTIVDTIITTKDSINRRTKSYLNGDAII
tara:strand:+ start:385 stop:762 length:378 start_codon:yes stop_codon:yes gene_type:complete